jgi:uncharacterized secreted protein with C-terminal beta-propeller domain
LEFLDDAYGSIIMKLTDSGNVGIGVANPNNKLDVGGKVRIAGNSSYLQPISNSYDLTIETAATNRRAYFA